MYKRCETVIYPTHGVGQIEEIVEKASTGENPATRYYIIQICATGAKIMMPVDNAEKLGIRGISDSKKILQAFKIIKKEPSLDTSGHWNRRHKEYMVKIKTGSILDMAEVYRDLTTLQLTKSLSFGEKKILENVSNLLSTEIAEAKGIKSIEAKKLLEKAVAVAHA